VWSFSSRQYGEIIRGVELRLSEVRAPDSWRGGGVAT
jgi:hypothetical protein